MRFLRLLLLVSIWVAPNHAVAQDHGQSLSFRVLKGIAPEAGIDDICCDPGGAIFGAEPVTQTRNGYGAAPLWLKLEGIPDSGLVQFTPVLDEIALYARSRGSDEWQAVRTGDLVSNSEKVFATPFMALPLPEDVDTSAVYARIVQPVPISIEARYWSLPPFIAMQNADRVLKTFLLGFIGAIIVYNLVVSVLVRDPAYALNALCIGSLLLLALYLSGYGVAYIWAEGFRWSNLISNLAILGGVVFGALFIFTFLRNPEERAAKFWPVFVGPAVALGAGAVLLLLQAPYWAFQIVLLASALLLLACTSWFAIRRAIAGERKARILLFPLFMAVVPGVCFVYLNKFTGLRLVSLGNNAMEITLAMEAILFSLALASRIRITEAANREAAQRLLDIRQRNAATVLAAQDGERKRLAKELHDSVGQEILVIVSRLKRLAGDPAASAFATRIHEITGMTTRTMNNLRRISRAMHPASIEHLGLEGTIEEVVDQLNMSGDIAFTCRIEMEGAEISHARQLHIVRAVQECLSNVARHSRATRCETGLSFDGARLTVRIADNGVGLNGGGLNGGGPDDGQTGFGLGLTSVDERVRSLGGQWRMQNGPGGGLVIEMTIPLDGREESRGEGRAAP